MEFKKIILLIFIFLNLVLVSQELSEKQLHVKDSLTLKLKADSVHIFRFQKLRPFFNVDQRNSFIKDAPINVYGIQLGTILHERHVIGLGGYAITASSQQKAKTRTNKNIDATRTLDMKYITVFYQYNAIDKRFFELDLQVEFGAGIFDVKFYDSKTWKLLLDRQANMLVTGIGPKITLKPVRWIGIDVMAGYRFTFEQNANLNFNGTYYALGLWLDLRQIIRDYRYYIIKKPKYKRHIHHLQSKN